MKQCNNPYWVRKRFFRCTKDEFNNHYSWINGNENFIIFGYGTIFWETEIIEIPVYYLEKADLEAGSPYRQSPGWEKTPWTAPDDAVSWLALLVKGRSF
jgi:hypothetical protein